MLLVEIKCSLPLCYITSEMLLCTIIIYSFIFIMPTDGEDIEETWESISEDDCAFLKTTTDFSWIQRVPLLILHKIQHVPILHHG